MRKIGKSNSMKIDGGHYVSVMRPHPAAEPGTAGYESTCTKPKPKHTLIHIYLGPTYGYNCDYGRTYICPRDYCNKLG